MYIYGYGEAGACSAVLPEAARTTFYQGGGDIRIGQEAARPGRWTGFSCPIEGASHPHALPVASLHVVLHKRDPRPERQLKPGRRVLAHKTPEQEISRHANIGARTRQCLQKPFIRPPMLDGRGICTRPLPHMDTPAQGPDHTVLVGRWGRDAIDKRGKGVTNSRVRKQR